MSSDKGGSRHRFTMASLRGMQQPDLSKKLFKLIKSENNAISAYEAASRERASIASQLSDWGESTGDDAVSEVSDKLGVLLSEIAEQEDLYAQNLEEYRSVLKQIRNTEGSVQPSRDQKLKITDEIQKLKFKEPSSPKIAQLEHELVRAEAQSLVAEAQLTNITRQKFKEAYDIHLAAIIERAEKQLLLAKHGRRLLNLLDDSPIVPGDAHAAFDKNDAARQVLDDAEDELRAWHSTMEPVTSSASSLGMGALPGPHPETRKAAASTDEPNIMTDDRNANMMTGVSNTNVTGEGSNASGGYEGPRIDWASGSLVGTAEKSGP